MRTVTNRSAATSTDVILFCTTEIGRGETTRNEPSHESIGGNENWKVMSAEAARAYRQSSKAPLVKVMIESGAPNIT